LGRLGKQSVINESLVILDFLFSESAFFFETRLFQYESGVLIFVEIQIIYKEITLDLQIRSQNQELLLSLVLGLELNFDHLVLSCERPSFAFVVASSRKLVSLRNWH
jgi:hypothetical protein